MKRVELKRPIQDPISKVNLMPGFHNFSEELFAHRFIKALVKNGSIVPQAGGAKPSVLPKSSATILRQDQNKEAVKNVKVEEILPKVKEVNSEVEVKNEEINKGPGVQSGVASVEAASVEETNVRRRRK